jgi:hypothetical protein
MHAVLGVVALNNPSIHHPWSQILLCFSIDHNRPQLIYDYTDGRTVAHRLAYAQQGGQLSATLPRIHPDAETRVAAARGRSRSCGAAGRHAPAVSPLHRFKYHSAPPTLFTNATAHKPAHTTPSHPSLHQKTTRLIGRHPWRGRRPWYSWRRSPSSSSCPPAPLGPQPPGPRRRT